MIWCLYWEKVILQNKPSLLPFTENSDGKKWGGGCSRGVLKLGDKNVKPTSEGEDTQHSEWSVIFFPRGL